MRVQSDHKAKGYSRRHRRRLAGLLAGAVAFSGAIGITATPASAAATVDDGDYASLVNPFVGTEDEGNAYPGAVLPFGMVQLSPDNTNNYGSTSYSNDAGRVWGFSHRHINSAGCPAAGELLVTPSTTESPVTEREFIGLKDQDSTEKATAGYYTAQLENDVTVELTATERTGVHRYSFPAGETSNLSFNVGETLNSTSESSVTWTDDQTLEGSVTSSGFCWGTPDVEYFFSASLDRPADSVGTWAEDGTYDQDSTTSTVEDGANGAVATFDTTTDESVEMTVGVSFVDVDGARANRDAEATADNGDPLSFDSVSDLAKEAWNETLGRFDVTTANDDELVIFYTQLYKSLLSPVIGSDVDGRYRGLDHEVHEADGWEYYQRFSLWDTYRTQATLHGLYEHDRARDITRSMHQARIEGGWLPRWTLDPAETNVMAGDPVSPWLAENFALDTVPDDISDEMWGYLVENATTAPSDDVRPVGRQSAEFYLEHGHIPFYAEGSGGLGDEYEEYRHGGSATMEFAHADAAIGAAAHRTGRDDQAAAFLDRGKNWQNLWNPDVELSGDFTGIVNAVTPDGEFVTAAEAAPVQSSGFHEGSPWHYQWMAPQDVSGLVDTMGGKEDFTSRLDYYFNMDELQEKPGVYPSTWAGGGSNYYSSIGYNPGNEPMLGNAWLYGFTGEPTKTGDVLAAHLNRFPNTPGGGVGNDDLGTMSSWYVLASLGAYPVMPGSGIMALNAPRVLEAKVTLDNGEMLEISAPNASAGQPRYIESMTINGEDHTAAWVDVSELQDGAKIEFELSDSADGLTWGTAPADRIPSVSDPLRGDLTLENRDQPITAIAGEELEVDLTTAEIAWSTGTPPTDSDASPIEATLDWGDDESSAATVERDGDSWLISTSRTFEDPGAYSAKLTVASSIEHPRFAPAVFESQSFAIDFTVEPAAEPGPDPDPGDNEGPSDDETPGGNDQGQGSDDSDGDTSSDNVADADDGKLPTTGVSVGLAILAVLTLLLAGVALRIRAQHRVRSTE